MEQRTQPAVVWLDIFYIDDDSAKGDITGGHSCMGSPLGRISLCKAIDIPVNGLDNSLTQFYFMGHTQPVERLELDVHDNASIVGIQLKTVFRSIGRDKLKDELDKLYNTAEKMGVMLDVYFAPEFDSLIP